MELDLTLDLNEQACHMSKTMTKYQLNEYFNNHCAIYYRISSCDILLWQCPYYHCS